MREFLSGLLFVVLMELSWFYAIYPCRGNKPGWFILRSSCLSVRRGVFLAVAARWRRGGRGGRACAAAMVWKRVFFY